MARWWHVYATLAPSKRLNNATIKSYSARGLCSVNKWSPLYYFFWFGTKKCSSMLSKIIFYLFKLYWTANTGPIYIGGHDSTVAGGRGFRGCISNIRIGESGDPIDFGRDPLIVANAFACKRSVKRENLKSQLSNTRWPIWSGNTVYWHQIKSSTSVWTPYTKLQLFFFKFSKVLLDQMGHPVQRKKLLWWPNKRGQRLRESEF